MLGVWCRPRGIKNQWEGVGSFEKQDHVVSSNYCTHFFWEKRGRNFWPFLQIKTGPASLDLNACSWRVLRSVSHTMQTLLHPKWAYKSYKQLFSLRKCSPWIIVDLRIYSPPKLCHISYMEGQKQRIAKWVCFSKGIFLSLIFRFAPLCEAQIPPQMISSESHGESHGPEELGWVGLTEIASVLRDHRSPVWWNLVILATIQ